MKGNSKPKPPKNFWVTSLQRRQSGLKSGGRESGCRSFGFESTNFSGKNSDDPFILINSKHVRCFKKIEKLAFTATYRADFFCFSFLKRPLSNILSLQK